MLNPNKADFIRAIIKKDESMALLKMEQILEFDFRVKFKNKPNEIPLLHLTIIQNLNTLTKKLLNKNINPLMQDNSGCTALHMSMRYNQFDISRQLITCYPQLMNIANNEGNTPLHIAAKNGDYNHLNLFLSDQSNLCEVNAINANQKSALHLAAENGKNEAVEILLEKNASKTLLDMNGYTASELAFVKFPELSRKLTFFPSLFTLTALEIEKHPTLFTQPPGDKHAEFFAQLIGKQQPSIDVYKKFCEDKKRAREQKRIDVENNLMHLVQAARRNQI